MSAGAGLPPRLPGAAVTVAELVAQLQQLPLEAEVYLEITEVGDANITHGPVSVGNISSEPHWAYPEGPYIVVLRED